MTNSIKIKQKFSIDRTTFQDIFFIPILATSLAITLGLLLLLFTGESYQTALRALIALFVGSFGSVSAISETLTAATPLIFAALGIAIGFRAGLFNIGAEGQIIIGGLAAVIIGFSVELPLMLHLTLMLSVGAAFGAGYAFISGWLKAFTGAHEVITTIMLNLIAFRLLDFFLRLPFIQKEGRNDPISKSVLDTAELPRLLTLIDPNLRIHAGFLLAILAVILIYWIIFHTTIGFEFRMVGTNMNAAKYAGVNSSLTVILAMSAAGLCAGLAGASQISGVLGRATSGFSAGIGFDAIAVALLGRAHPIGVLFSGILFGALVAGGREMQVTAGVSLDLITVIQALIIIFIAAPILVKSIFPWFFRKT
jgi:simple sugar transport system permease protein